MSLRNFNNSVTAKNRTKVITGDDFLDMNVFEYKARSKEGLLVTDTMAAENEQAVITRLQAGGYFPVEINVKREISSKAVKKPLMVKPAHVKISGQDLSFLTRQLSNLITAGMPLLNALEVLVRQTEHKRVQYIIRSLRNDIHEGKSLSEALSVYPKIFSRLYKGMIKTGETSGTLEQTLQRLSEFIEKQEDFKRQLRAAMSYPLIMAVLGTATILFLISYVVPKLVEMFNDIGQTLPLPTQMLIGLSHHLKSYGLLYLGGIALVIIVCRQSAHTAEGRRMLDVLKLHLPIIGPLHRKMVLARFARVLGTLVINGVPVLYSLELVAQAIGNESVAQEVGLIRQKVQEGSSLAIPLKKSKFFPSVVADLIGVSEVGGHFEQTLMQIADSTDREVEIDLRTLTSMIEPAMIIIMGVVVGFIVIAMLMPVFQMSAFVR